MSWENVTPGKRWSWTADDVRHVLAAVGTDLREYVEQEAGPATVHVYEPDDLYEGRSESHGDLSSVVYPLLETTWVATYEVAAEHEPWVRALDDRELFEWLESAGYVK